MGDRCDFHLIYDMPRMRTSALA